MVKKLFTLIFVFTIFFLGFFVSSSYSFFSQNIAMPLQTLNIFETPFSPSSTELPSPYDHIKENQIHVYDDKIVITLSNPEWASFTDTNSMDPVFDYGANAIEIIPQSTEQIHLGDIISYRSKYSNIPIIHRVINIGEDNRGWYCKVKGDNNKISDLEKIRFNQVERLVVAIIY